MPGVCRETERGGDEKIYAQKYMGEKKGRKDTEKKKGFRSS